MTSQRKPEKTVWVKGPARKGAKVIKPAMGAAGHRLPRRARFYNPDGENFVACIPYGWAMSLAKDGDVEFTTAPKADHDLAPAPMKKSGGEK